MKPIEALLIYNIDFSDLNRMVSVGVLLQYSSKQKGVINQAKNSAQFILVGFYECKAQFVYCYIAISFSSPNLL